MRKTFEVNTFRKMANDYFASENSTVDGREALSAMLDVVLFDTGNYRGFRYLEVDEENGFLPVEGSGTKVKYL